MAEIGIFREPTDEEKRQFIPLGNKPGNEAVNRFKKALEIEDQKYKKEYRPFCARCAKLDFQDRIDKIMLEAERKIGYAENIQIEIPDFAPYGKEDRFTFLKEQNAMEPIGAAQSMVQGTVVRQIKIGVHRDYKCKERGCGISIFIPNEVLALEKKK